MAARTAVRLRYEHVVRLNDVRLPAPALTRTQVWHALAGRARAPAHYDPTISLAEIDGDDLRLLRRYERLGVAIEDEVRLEPESRVTFVTRLPAPFCGSTLRISIDEPAAGVLFLRFAYELCGSGEPLDAREAAALRDAYHHADLDFVRRLRELALA